MKRLSPLCVTLCACALSMPLAAEPCDCTSPCPIPGTEYLIADRLAGPDYAVDCSSTDASAPWQTLFVRNAPAGEGLLFAKSWSQFEQTGDASGPLNAPGDARHSHLMLREGQWVAARNDNKGLAAGTLAAGALARVQTPCTPVGSCGGAACEEINLSYSLNEWRLDPTSSSLLLLYCDWYFLEDEEASIMLRRGLGDGCAPPQHLAQPLGGHRHVYGADAPDAFWVVSHYTRAGQSQLRYLKMTKDLTTATETGVLASELANEAGDEWKPFHAIASFDATVQVVYANSTGVHLSDLTAGTTQSLCPQPGSRPTLAAGTQSSGAAAWEDGENVKVWTQGSIYTISGAQRPRLERDGDGRIALFYLRRPSPEAPLALYARPLQP